MSNFAAAHATGQDLGAMLRKCVEQLTDGIERPLGFVYVTDHLAPQFERIIETLKVETGIEHWIGTVGLGICASGTEYFDEPAISLLTCGFEPDSYRVIPVLTARNQMERRLDRNFMSGIGVVHGDPRQQNTLDLVAGLAEDYGTFLVGGLTSAQDHFAQVAGSIGDGGLSGVLVGGRIQVAVGLTQGCSPIGPPHTITHGQDNILVTLDGQPAYEVLCEDLGVAEGVDPRPWLDNVHAASLVTGSDTGDYLVRHLVGLDPAQGLVAIADVVEQGSRIAFVRRDSENAAKDLRRMLGELQGRAATPKAGLYFSCLARGPNLFDEPSFELQEIRRTFGDIPIAGFFGNGEISNDRIYGYTGVLTLFL